MSLLHALKHTTDTFDVPFRHWGINSPLTNAMCEEVTQTSISNAPRAFDGTRAADNGGGAKDAKLRVYVQRDNINQFPAIGRLVDELLNPETIDLVSSMIQRDLSDAYLRVEVIADRQGFWLKPHKDIKEKLMSMLLYVNPWDEDENLGTDLYDDKLNIVKTVPYRDNSGYMFAPGEDTWHGLEKKEIRQERRSMLINYVTFPTDWPLPSRRRAAA